MKTCQVLWFPWELLLLSIFCSNLTTSSSTFAQHQDYQNDDARTTTVVSDTKHVIVQKKNLGIIRYHYSHKSLCSTVVIIGVGTAMSVSNYDKLAKKIAVVAPTSVVMIVDHNEGSIIKTSAEKYALLVNAIKAELSTLIPICSETKAKIVIGGHSSSGEATFLAIKKNLIQFKPIGLIGLDPFDISKRIFGDFLLQLPALYWGFSRSTCLVTKEEAAEGAYRITQRTQRVLYQIQNNKPDYEMTHCVFTDHGCGIHTCPTEEKYEWMLEYVANSTKLFLAALDEDIRFSRHYFEKVIKPSASDAISFFVNNEEIVSEHEIITVK